MPVQLQVYGRKGQNSFIQVIMVSRSLDKTEICRHVAQLYEGTGKIVAEIYVPSGGIVPRCTITNATFRTLSRARDAGISVCTGSTLSSPNLSFRGMLFPACDSQIGRPVPRSLGEQGQRSTRPLVPPIRPVIASTRPPVPSTRPLVVSGTVQPTESAVNNPPRLSGFQASLRNDVLIGSDFGWAADDYLIATEVPGSFSQDIESDAVELAASTIGGIALSASGWEDDSAVTLVHDSTWTLSKEDDPVSAATIYSESTVSFFEEGRGSRRREEHQAHTSRREHRSHF